MATRGGKGGQSRPEIADADAAAAFVRLADAQLDLAETHARIGRAAKLRSASLESAKAEAKKQLARIKSDRKSRSGGAK